jgi:hypothetical protein
MLSAHGDDTVASNAAENIVREEQIRRRNLECFPPFVGSGLRVTFYSL